MEHIPDINLLKTVLDKIENLTFLFGKLESLDSKAQLHIMPYDKDYSVRINCISEAEARRASMDQKRNNTYIKVVFY